MKDGLKQFRKEDKQNELKVKLFGYTSSVAGVLVELQYYITCTFVLGSHHMHMLCLSVCCAILLPK